MYNEHFYTERGGCEPKLLEPLLILHAVFRELINLIYLENNPASKITSRYRTYTII